MDFDLPLVLTPLSSDLPSDHHRYWIAFGPSGTEQTIQRMRKVVSSTLQSMRKGVTRGKRIFGIRKLIGEIIQPCEPKNYYCYAQRLYEYCRDQIKYTFDPVGVELVESPERILLESKIADCDSIVTVLATLYEAIGLPARFVTVKADPIRPNDYSHVFLEVNLPRHGWVAADPTMPDKQFGWRPDPKFKFKNWPASLDPESDVRDDVLELKPVGTEGMGMFGDYLTLPQAQQARPLQGMGDYLILPQVQQARSLQGMGASVALTPDQQTKARAMLQALQNLKSRLDATSGYGQSVEDAQRILTNGIDKFKSDIEVWGDWAVALKTYQGLTAIAEQALAKNVNNQSINYNTMTPQQSLAVGPYSQSAGVYAAPATENQNTALVVVVLALVAAFLMGDKS